MYNTVITKPVVNLVDDVTRERAVEAIKDVEQTAQGVAELERIGWDGDMDMMRRAVVDMQHKAAKARFSVVEATYNHWLANKSEKWHIEVAETVAAMTGDCSVWNKHGYVRLYAKGKSLGDVMCILGSFGRRSLTLAAKGHNWGPHRRLMNWLRWTAFCAEMGV